MGRFVDDNAANGPLGYGRWLKTEARLRARLADLLHANSPEDIALVKNTSEGLNLVASGLEWKPGDAVVLPAGEFLSNALPWRALGERGVEVREVAFEPADPEAVLIDALDDRTRLLAVSSVRYDSGIRIDLQRLARAAHACGALVCVDAIQELGALEMDVGQLDVDFLVAGAHKWLLAPEGLGVFWSAPRARARLRQTQHGWRMWEDMFSFRQPRAQPPDSGRRFEPGTLNMAGIHALDAAVGLLLEIGPGSVAEALLARSRRILAGLKDLPGIRIETPDAAGRHGGITSFVPSQRPAPELVKRLASRGIHAAARGPAVRLSPHFYTPLEQIDRALEAIADLSA